MRSEGDTMPSLGRGLFILSPLVLYPVVDFIFRIAKGLIAPRPAIGIRFERRCAWLHLKCLFRRVRPIAIAAGPRLGPLRSESRDEPVSGHGQLGCFVARLGRQHACFGPRTDTHGCRYVRQLDRGDQDHLDLVARPTDLDDLAVDRCDGHRRHVRHCPLSIAARGRRLANAFHDSRRGNISSIVPSSTR